jgi:hypothetical protein
MNVYCWHCKVPWWPYHECNGTGPGAPPPLECGWCGAVGAWLHVDSDGDPECDACAELESVS